MVEKKRWRLAPKKKDGRVKEQLCLFRVDEGDFFLFPKITSREQKATESRAETTCLDNISSRRLGKKRETFRKEEKEEKAECGDSRPPV